MKENVIIANCDDTLARKGYTPAVASQYFADGKYSRAVDICLQFMEKEPDSVSARLIVARSLFHAGEKERACEHFQKVLNLDVNNLAALKYLGDILFAEGKEAIAMSYYRRIFELDPHNNGLHCSITREDKPRTWQLTLKRPKEKSAKRKKLILEPVFVTETVGDIYKEQGYFELAGEVYRRLLTGSENNRIAGKLREIEGKIKEKEEKV
ncbi:MAG: tetratricopeptide repeat protein [candidate division Zixibacteria bacterium]|nr:tetratricopeptide repeat protein [candidate division Zixibacteria bacterium]